MPTEECPTWRKWFNQPMCNLPGLVQETAKRKLAGAQGPGEGSRNEVRGRNNPGLHTPPLQPALVSLSHLS